MALVLEALGLGATMISIGLPSILKTFPTTQIGWLTTAYFLNGTYIALAIGAVVFGVSSGLVNSSVPSLVMRATPAGDQGSTAGAAQLCQTGFSSITR